MYIRFDSNGNYTGHYDPSAPNFAKCNLEEFEILDKEYSYSDIRFLRKVNGQIIIDQEAKAESERQIANRQRISEIKARLTELTKDFAQAQAGLIVPDIEQRKTEFVTLHNELRALLGLEPRGGVNK